MPSNLPINIKELLNGHVVESDRLELKEGWNPGAILRTICAFANDTNNVGGGYIVIGISCEDGQMQLPPKGIAAKDLDKIQQDLLALTHLVQPQYLPIFSIEKYAGQFNCVLWVPGGTNRPYQIPRHYPSKDKSTAYFIRQYSSSVEAKGIQLTDLISLTAQLPFDDRVCQRTTIDLLSIPLITEYLEKVGSALAEEVPKLKKHELCKKLQIVDGPNEKLWPRNVGILFFSDDPQAFIPNATLDVVWFPNGKSSDRFEEKVFTGPLHKQLSGALEFIQTRIISERVVKQQKKIQALRFSNYPLTAVREALVNAVYHKAYDVREPIVVTIEPNRIRVHNVPGPEKSVSLSELSRGEGTPGRYRNRRIGDLLKELDLTEGRGTGIPKMLASMKENGSPPPVFKSDAERSYFIVDLPIHPDYIANPLGAISHNVQSQNRKVANQTKDSKNKPKKATTEKNINQLLQDFLSKQTFHYFSATDLQLALGYKSKTGALRRLIESLLEEHLLEREFSDKPRSKNQRYRVPLRKKKTSK